MIFFSATDGEFATLADTLRPYTKQTMKMDVAPWIRDYSVDLDKLFTSLTYEVKENTPADARSSEMKGYQNIFESRNSQNPKGQRILLVADPGYGKTSLSRKIMYDWGKGIFRSYTLVLPLSLKMLKPGDAIEKLLIQQTPSLEAMGVSPRKLQRILETFGDKCLIILDGLDEHTLRSNDDVTKIIEGENLPQCSVLITSRPHSIGNLRKYFSTIVWTRGFTQETAVEFGQKILDDPDQVKTAINLTTTPLMPQALPYICPLLLSFKCLLVRDEDIGFLKKTMFIGDIYAKMIQCLFKVFILRKGISYQATDFTDTLQKIGGLALKNLLSGNYEFERSEIIRKIGGDAFNYGLIVGHENASVTADEVNDIKISFLDEGIQYFLGAFHFIHRLSNGESLNDALDSCQKKLTLMTKSIFLHFCLWLLKQKSEHQFSLRNKDHTYHYLQRCTRDQLLGNEENVTDLPSLCSTLGISHDEVANDELIVNFLEEILADRKSSKSLHDEGTFQLSTGSGDDTVKLGEAHSK